MRVNHNAMLKAEILSRLNFTCSHRHDGLTHGACFDKAMAAGERIGILDIESGGSLDANWGFVFSYCLKELDGPMLKRCITPAEVRQRTWGVKYPPKKNIKDMRIVKQFCKDAKDFDTFVVYYGRDRSGRFQGHDIPFLRTRAVKWGINDFPDWKSKKVVDIFDVVSGKFKMSRKSQDIMCRFLGIPSKATPLQEDIWSDALMGNKPALDYILRHNEEDVLSLERLYHRIFKFKGTKTSI